MTFHMKAYKCDACGSLQLIETDQKEKDQANRILRALWDEWQLRTDPESPNDLLGPEGMYGLDPETTDAVDKRRMHAAAQAMRAAEALYRDKAGES